MRYALMTEPQQGLSYEEIRAVTRTAEEAGFEAFFRSDHYTSFPGESGLPTTDAWTTLAGLARETRSIRLGVLVSPVTFRLPGPFAKVVGTVDEMSDGRVEVGIGAGWNEQEHREHGIPFPTMRERFAMLEETVAIVHGLWTEPDGWRWDGRYWQVDGARLRPSPARAGRRHPHLLLGGSGRPRALALAARYADEYNLSSASPERAAEVRERLRAACSEAGRDPDQVVFSAMTGVLVAETEADLRDRVRALLELMGGRETEADAWLEERRGRWVIGTPDQALERVASFERAGVERLMLQDFLPRDLAHVSLLGRAVVRG